MIEKLTLEQQEKIQLAADKYSNINNAQHSSISYLIAATGRNGFIAGIEWYLSHKEEINVK